MPLPLIWFMHLSSDKSEIYEIRVFCRNILSNVGLSQGCNSRYYYSFELLTVFMTMPPCEATIFFNLMGKKL